MVLPLLGSIIGAGASLIGGAMNKASTEAANEKNYQAQKEFAQQGLRWKVEDGKAAGIHPLYAVGAPTQSFSASYVGDQSMGQSIANAGQDIGGAIARTQPVDERIQSFNDQTMALQLERGTLENELLRLQIRRALVGSRPAFPSATSDVQGDTVTSDDMGRIVSSNLLPDVVIDNQTPASTVQNEYGEFVGDTHGVLRYLDTVLPVLPEAQRTYVPGGGSRRAPYVESRPAAPGPNIGPRVRY